MVISRGLVMRSIPAGEFKARCLAIMDEVLSSGESIVITKRGRPVVRIGPAGTADSHPALKNDIFGFMRNPGSSIGDIVGPILPADSWSHLRTGEEPEGEV
jgi:prevent-host-death family protein